MAGAGIGEAAALGSAALWALSSIVMGAQTARTPAVVVSAMRGLAGALSLILLAGVLYIAGDLSFPGPSTSLALVCSGMLGLGLGDTIYIRCLGILGVSRAFPISMSAYPLFTFLLAAAVLGESVHPLVLVGGVLIIAGIVLIVSGERAEHPDGSDEPPADPRRARLGLGMALLSAGLWAGASVWLRAASDGVDPIAAQTVRTPAAAALVTGIALGAGHRGREWALSRRTLGALLITGVIGTAAGSVLFVIAVQRAGAGRVSLLASTAPLFALPMATLLLGEKITRRVLAGTGLTIAGIWLVIGA